MSNYKITARANSLCPARTKVLSMIDTGNTSFKTVIGKEKVNGRFAMYIDCEEPESLFALIDIITDDKEEKCDASDIEMLVSRNYPVTLLSRSGNTLYASIDPGETPLQANPATEAVSERVTELVEQKISEGIVAQEEMDARLKVFTDNRVDEALLYRVIQGYRKYAKPVRKPSCIYVDPYIDNAAKSGEEGIIAEGLRHAVMRFAAICEGEKSVGKNVYLETLAWLLNMPLYLITFSRQMSPSSIYGEKSTDNSASEALADSLDLARASVFARIGDATVGTVEDAARFELLKARAASVNIVIDASELYDWLSDGGLMVFNEMNMAEANFFASFTNQLLDGTGFLFVPGRGDVQIHRDCVLFGTQNAEYEGTEQQNEATMSRFNCIYFPQPDSIKRQLIAAVGAKLSRDGFTDPLTKQHYDEVEAFYTNCRKAVRSGTVSNACLNIRGFVRALTTVAESGGICKVKRWVLLSVINTCPFDERDALGNFLDAIITL